MKRSRKLGERKIIEIIQGKLDMMPQMPVPFGDDVSAYEIEGGKLAVLKTDMLVDKTDVPFGMSRWQAARKAVVMNVSDFAAKGVQPIAILVSVGLPQSLTQRDVEQIGEGLNAGAREYGAYIIGGDTGEASDLVISITLFGVAEKRKMMLRSGARPGDLLAVTGDFGNTSAGLKIMKEGFKAPREIKNTLVKSVLMPHARLREGLALSETEAVSAAIDSSDGLAWSLHEISRASRVGIRLDSLPTSKETERFAGINRLDSTALSLYGGEEYELVVTVKPKLWGNAEKAVEHEGGRLFKIGRVTSKKGIFLSIHGERLTIEPRGYEHFKA